MIPDACFCYDPNMVVDKVLNSTKVKEKLVGGLTVTFITSFRAPTLSDPAHRYVKQNNDT